MKVKRTIHHITTGDMGTDEIPIAMLEPGDQVRVGVEKGTLEKAVFTTTNGFTIIYERVAG